MNQEPRFDENKRRVIIDVEDDEVEIIYHHHLIRGNHHLYLQPPKRRMMSEPKYIFPHIFYPGSNSPRNLLVTPDGYLFLPPSGVVHQHQVMSQPLVQGQVNQTQQQLTGIAAPSVVPSMTNNGVSTSVESSKEKKIQLQHGILLHAQMCKDSRKQKVCIKYVYVITIYSVSACNSECLIF